jgi:hypothetical protein
MAKWNAALARASAAAAATVTGLLACSSSSSSSGDSGTTANLPALGVPLDCDDKNCPLPATCAGTLLGPSTGAAVCTLSCTTNDGCPSGTVCDFKHTHAGDCLKSCTTDSDCSGGFACTAGKGVNGASQKVCWSPYNGADAVNDGGGGVGPAGGADTGSGNDAGASEAGSGPDAVSGAETGSDNDGGGGSEAAAEAGGD